MLAELRIAFSGIVLLQILDQGSQLVGLCEQRLDEPLQNGFVLHRGQTSNTNVK